MTRTLAPQWAARLAAHAEAARLTSRADGSAEELCSATALKIFSEANLAWANAVLAAFGDIQLKWRPCNGGWNCILPNGEFYHHPPIDTPVERVSP